MRRLHRKITAEEFDKKFGEGKDMGDYLDKGRAIVNKQLQRVNVDFPSIFLRKLDKEAEKIGVARTALIKIWIAEKLGYA